jgi:hypothetical protein
MRISSRIDTARTQDLQHLGTYSVAGVPLALDACTLTFDESYLPFAMLRMRAKAPETQAELDALDPRKVSRVKVAMGYRYVDGEEEMDDMADLVLDERSVSRPDNIMELNAQGNERLVIDRGVGVSPLVFGPDAEVFTSIVSTIRRAIPGARTQDDGTRRRGWVPAGETVTIDPGDNPLSVILDAADRLGELWVYDDGLGVWHITRRPTLASTPFLSLTVGEAGTLVKTSSRYGRSEWANCIVLRHKWRDAEGNEHVLEQSAEVITGEYRTEVVGRKVILVERDTPIDRGSARAAASALLRRAFSRGRTLTLEAIADYRLRPGHTVRVQLPLGEPELHLVSAVHFEQPSGLMTVETRAPDNATISTGE